MEEGVPFTIGAEVSCTDGPCGHLSRVIVNPVASTVTHLVIKPPIVEGLGRLAPVELVDAAAGQLRLRCTIAEFEQLDSAEETQFLPGSPGYGPYGPAGSSAWPYYGLGSAAVNAPTAAAAPQAISYDKVPLGEVEIRRGDHVHATDGRIGRVQGLVIEPDHHHVTHVLLQEGHLWGRKEVVIPISAISAVEEESIRLNLTKREIEDLPPVAIDHPQS